MTSYLLKSSSSDENDQMADAYCVIVVHGGGLGDGGGGLGGGGEGGGGLGSGGAGGGEGGGGGRASTACESTQGAAVSA